ncbi:MAG: hypothetical protein IT269_04605 [Saprospiraceae bacterium]|nr:hypothetical protein [Saprospiraceae bacterium]
MILILLTWIYIALMTVPVGWALQRWTASMFTGQLAGEPGLLDSVMIGMAALSVYLGAFSLFFPIQASAHGIWWLVVAITGWSVHDELRHALKRSERRAHLFCNVGYTGIFLCMAVVLAYAVQQPQVYDSALYHVQSIRWITEYPAIPGLGHMHGRLAFNSHFFLLSAFFDSSWLGVPNGFALNSAIVLLLLWRIIGELSRSLALEASDDMVFYLALLTFSLFFLVKYVHSPTPDVFVASLVLWILVWLTRWKHAIKRERPGFNLETFKRKQQLRAAHSGYFITPVSLIFLAVTAKLSAAFAAFLIPLFLPFQWRNYLKIAAIGSVILLPFLIRNYVLSGWLVYPFPGIDLFSPDWKIPMEQVVAEKNFIECWSRAFAYDLSRTQAMTLLDWLPGWWARQELLWKVVLLLNAVSGPLALYYYRRLEPTFGQHKSWWIGAMLMNVAFWWVTAPDPRFAGGFLIGNAALTLQLVTYFNLTIYTVERFTKFAILGFVLLSVGLIGMKLRKISLHELWQPAPMAKVAARQYHHRAIPTWVPEVGERCFDCPIPCAPDLNERIKLRGKTIKEGFRIISD